MIKVPDRDYDKRNIFVVICDRYSVMADQVMVVTANLLKR